LIPVEEGAAVPFGGDSFIDTMVIVLVLVLFESKQIEKIKSTQKITKEIFLENSLISSIPWQ